MKIEPLCLDHVYRLKNAESYGFINGQVSDQMAATLDQAGGYSVIDRDEVIAIGGVIELWEGVGLGWSVLTPLWRRRAKAITNAVRVYLDASPFHRIEIGVKADFRAGHRWAEKLGFELECPRMRQWGPDREDYALYAKVK